MALADLFRSWGQSLVGANATVGLSSAHFSALGRLMSALPVGDLLLVLEGRSTLASNIDLAERAAALLAAAYPPAAITGEEVELALKALQYLLDAAGVGANPFKITPGFPPWFPPGGGPGIFRGR